MTNRRKALITGGTSGIGLAIAEELIPIVDVIIAGRDIGQGEEAMQLIRKKYKSENSCSFVQLNVREEAMVEKTMEQLCKVHNIEILVNGAGIGGGGYTVNNSSELWNDIIETNLTGTFLVTRAMLKYSNVLKSGWGRIINIASTGGKQGVMFAAAYSASKHGVVGFTKSLGLELAKTGTTVNAVCPGFVESRMAEKARANYASLWNCSVDEAKNRIEQRIPIGRYVEPAEVAGLVKYLISDSASAVVAQAFNVCGGLGNY